MGLGRCIETAHKHGVLFLSRLFQDVHPGAISLIPRAFNSGLGFEKYFTYSTQFVNFYNVLERKGRANKRKNSYLLTFGVWKPIGLADFPALFLC